MYRLETERNDLERKVKNSSLESSFRSSYEKDFRHSEDMPFRMDSGFDKLKFESDTYKKSLSDATLSAQYLKERVKNLQKGIEEFPSAGRRK